MAVAGVVITLLPVSSGRSAADGRRPPRSRPALRPLAALLVEAALGAGLDEVVVVTDGEEMAARLPPDATVLLEQAIVPSESSALRAAVDWCARAGHDAVVVAGGSGRSADAPVEPASWHAIAVAGGGPVVVGTRDGRRVGPVRIDAQAWPLLPLAGPIEALWRSRPELVVEVVLPASATLTQPRRVAHREIASPDRSEPEPEPQPALPPGESASPADVAVVASLLGREAKGRFTVVVRGASGVPVVIRNEPLLADGTPMPTRFWLVGATEREAVGRLESTGGVRAAEGAVDAGDVAAAHLRYAAERDAILAPDHAGPRPSGGVGGTRRGVKCLHAHLAWYLAGGGDPVGRWVATQLAGEIRGAVAAVDCGTNSTRLLVLDATGRPVTRQTTITRLGEGVDATGALAPDAMKRTLVALGHYRDLMDASGVVAFRATATSAARDASNAQELFVAAASVLGAPLELIDGAEEGRLSYEGATAELPATDGPYLVVDLGGGSTELVVGRSASPTASCYPVPDPHDGRHERAPEPDANVEPAATVSLDVGCVRITERFLRSDPPAQREVAAARDATRRLLDRALEEHPALRSGRRLVGVAGTVSTLATLHLGLPRHDRERVHHSVLPRTAVDELAEDLLATQRAALAARPGIEPGRADVIAGGAIVLAEVMARTGHDELVVSESDILDGIAAGLLRRLPRD